MKTHETTNPEILSKARELGLEIVEHFDDHSFVETATGKAVRLTFSSPRQGVVRSESILEYREDCPNIHGGPTIEHFRTSAYVENETIDGQLIAYTELICCDKHSSPWGDKKFVGFVYADS